MKRKTCYKFQFPRVKIPLAWDEQMIGICKPSLLAAAAGSTAAAAAAATAAAAASFQFIFFQVPE
jgi:hypothetical protein